MGAFCSAGMINGSSAISPCETQPAVVFSNTEEGSRGEDEEDDEEVSKDTTLAGHEVQNNQDKGEAMDPESVEVTLSDGEELEETLKQRILPDPGEPTVSQREDHRASGHITFRSWCEDCVAGRAPLLIASRCNRLPASSRNR